MIITTSTATFTLL